MKFVKAFFKRPWLIIAVCLVITGVLGFFLKDLKIDNSIRQFLPQKSDSYTRLNETEDVFGSMVVIGVSIEDKNGDILTPENIQVIRNITDRALDLEVGDPKHPRKEVDGIDSLTHIDYVCSEDGSISAMQLIPDSYTGTEADIAQLRQRLVEWNEMYGRVIVNDDFSATQMQITVHSLSPEERADLEAQAKEEGWVLPTDAERQQEVLDGIRAIVQEETASHSNLDFKIFGDPVVAESARSFMLSDLVSLIPLVIVVVLLSLFFSFKTLDGTLLPLITVAMATIWTCGLMAVLHVTFTIVSSVIPVALIAVGSAYGIHVLTHYYVAIKAQNGTFTKETYQEAVFAGLKEVWNAVLLAGITTIVGFISLVSSPIEPLHSFAIFTAVGVGISLLLAVTFIPAILLAKNIDKVNRSLQGGSKITAKVKRRLEMARQRRGGASLEGASGNTLYNIYRFFCGTKPRLVVFMLVLVVFSIVGLRYLHIDTALVNYFPANSELRQDINYVDRQFAGTNSVYFIVKSPEDDDMRNTEVLKAVDDMQSYLAERHEGIGKIVSFTTFVKRINQVWHAPENADSSMAGSDDYSSEGDLPSFGSFDDEALPSFGGEDEELPSFGSFEESSDLPSFDFGEEETSSGAPADWVDPMPLYTERLSATMTTEQILDMLNQAYVAAGGRNATVEKMVDILQRQFNYNGMAYYEIPYDVKKYPVASKEELSGVVDGYLTLLSGSLDRFLDDELNPNILRVTCQLRNHSTQETGEIIADAQQFAAIHFPAGYTLEATGAGEMEYTMTNMIVSSQISSLLISLLSVFIIITVSFKSGFAGLIGAVPLALAILLNYMTMGFSGINLDLVTSIIASVAVGVGIDYTIHFLSTYKEERSKTNDLEVVTRQTFVKSGHGIVTNAIAVGLGFLVLCLSKFVVLRYIGVLVAIVMFTSSFLAMTVIPGILNIADPKFIRPKEEVEAEKNNN